MTEKELQAYLLEAYPKENESCEWKEFKNLTHAFSGNKGDDIISYVSALANMDGGHLVIGGGGGGLGHENGLLYGDGAGSRGLRRPPRPRTRTGRGLATAR